MPDPNTQTQSQTEETSSNESASGESAPNDNVFDDPSPENVSEGPSENAESGESLFETPADLEGERSPSQSQQFDQEGSTEPDGEPRPEDDDDSTSDPGADAEDAATSEQSDAEARSDSDDDAVEETDSDDPFFEGEHSVYNSKEDALQGIEEKDRYIQTIQEKLETTEDQASQEIDKLQSELEQRNEELERLRGAVDEQTREEIAIQEYLPEEYQNKTEADFADDEELREYRRAKARAEVQMEKDREKTRRDQEEMRKEVRRQHEEAKEFVEDRLDPEEFGATSPERKAKLREFLGNTEGEYTPTEKAQFIVAAFGEEDGNRFLSGLQAEWSGETATSTTSNQSNPEDRASETEEVTEQIKKSKTKPDVPDSKPRTESNDMDSRQELDYAFRQSAQQNGLNVRG